MTLKSFAEQAQQEFALIGTSLAESKGNTIETCAVGLSDIAKQTALTPDSQFLIYSITKTFIAALVMLQQERGKLSLSDTINEWFPEIPDAGKLTVRQLLNHTSGLPDYGGLPEYHRAVKENPLEAWSEEEFLEKTSRQGLLFEPGNGWRYSNIGYLLLVRLLQKIEGKSFKDIVTERIFQPLKLENSFVPTVPEDLHLLTPGYSDYLAKNEATPIDVRFNYHPDWVSHKVIASTPTDIMRFLKALFDGEIVNHDSLTEMMETINVPHPHPHFKNPGYGLGLMSAHTDECGDLFGHGGSGPGYSAFAFHSPAKNQGVCVLINTENSGAVEQIAQRIINSTETKTLSNY